MSSQPATVTVHYWAAARAATGVESETVEAGRLGDLLAALALRHSELERVLQVASVLVDGVQSEPDVIVNAGSSVEILPPFAGG
ncbi:MoaD/ThiS family protein [Gephyromycinifex aptenodytis]|uniref:MoaD/ThiS family protein n=1 Tax=Gephyromycinifex aptenodytis TaxID=2716227 RepID=UPI001D02E572|nr:MoaD/ThiS family protein [Gephyromycinifex aptenodytis]